MLVTYKGPKDSEDPTTRFVTADGLLLPIGQQVEVPDAAAKKLRKVEGHSFEFGKPDKGQTKEE